MFRMIVSISTRCVESAERHLCIGCWLILYAADAARQHVMREPKRFWPTSTFGFDFELCVNGCHPMVPSRPPIAVFHSTLAIDWILRNVRGLPPTNRSLILRWSENLHTNQERLHKLRKAESAKCLLCSDDATDNRQHLWFCNFNSTINKATLRMIESTSEKACSPNQLCVFDFAIPTQLHLPIMFSFNQEKRKKLLNIKQT